jgi:hypothetical protein
VREGLGPTGRLWATDSSPDATLTGDVHAGGSRSAPKQGRWGGGGFQVGPRHSLRRRGSKMV